jgi:lipopolysaccharide/colanic/teichoic acid biosynthesis glycosyltransferase
MTTLSETTSVSPNLPVAPSSPTIWGLSPAALHDHYWASRGVQVVRAGERTKIVRNAELFLLIDPQVLVLFDLEDWLDLLNWTKPDILLLRIHARRNLGYREVFNANEGGDFVGFQRRYTSEQTLATRVGLTCDLELAEAWAAAPGVGDGWRQLRAAVPGPYRETRSCPARIYRRSDEAEVAKFVEDLTTIWNHPGATISRARKLASKTWVDIDADIDKNTKIISPVWVGAGRRLVGDDVVVGPAALWDDPAHCPQPERIRWADIEPTAGADRPAAPRTISTWNRGGKRFFDVIFALFALAVTLPLYPFVMLAIFLENGWPFFYSHERETLGGRIFRCVKFRSMHKNSDRMKAELAEMNQADGPQFFIEDDPRLTRVGRLLRKTHVDELPQFFNVLLGHMSVVGPRPSPHIENQYCAEWRDARLSVRPGITGLWQVRRTRLRGRDFQEWIKYDIQYVDTMNWRLDIKLIWQTILVVIQRAIRS